MRIKLYLLLLFNLFLIGCSVIPDPIYTPVKLESLKERKIKLKTHWLDSAGIGDMWRGYDLRPALKDDFLVTSDVEGWIRGLDLKNKRELWTFDTKNGISAPVVLSKDKVFLATQNGDLLALDAKTGLLVWNTSIKSEVLAISELNETNGILALATSDSKIIGIEAETGVQKWQYEIQMGELTLSGAGAPLVLDLIVYAPLANGKLAGLDAETGDLKFITQISTAKGATSIENLIDLNTSPQIVSGLVFVAGFNGKMAALEAFSGNKVWEKDYSTYTNPLVEKNMIYLVNEKSQIEALDFRKGAIVWKQEKLYGRDLTGGVSFGENIAVADTFGYIHIIDKSNGEIIGRRWFDAQGVITPLVSNDKYLIAEGRRGKLGVFTLDTNIW